MRLALNFAGAPFDRPFYLIYNVAVGGQFPGGPTADAQGPYQMFVDYVRVYEVPGP